MSEENDLKKGLMGPLAAGLMTIASMSPKLHAGFDKAAAGTVATPQPVATTPPVAPFKPESLHPDMHGIAFLETSYGKNMNHAADPKGEFDTAYGPLGFKPSTAFDEFYKSKHLTKIYPDFVDKEKFTNEFKTNPDFYNLVAGTHWNRLKKNTGTPSGTAFAWRHGLNAFKQAKPEIVEADDYVKKYNKALTEKPWAPQPAAKPTAMKKSEAFAIDSLSQADRLAQGFKVAVSEDNGTITATLTQSNKVLASLGAQLVKSQLIVTKAEMDFGVKGAGFGRLLCTSLTDYVKPLIKKLQESDLKHFGSAPQTLTINHHLTPASPHQEGKAHFEKHIDSPNHTPAIYTTPDDPFDDNGPLLHPGAQKKSIFNFDNSKYLMKSAHGDGDPHAKEGFAESLTQALYHAAGEKDLVQKSHLSNINGRHFLVIHMDPKAQEFYHFQEDAKRDHSKPISEHFGYDLLQRHPGIREQAKKIALMDYLTSNADRHNGNLMVRRGASGRPESLLSIDHGLAFETQKEEPLRIHPNESMSPYLLTGPTKAILNDHHSLLPNSHWSKALQWIHDNSAKMSQEVEKHVAAIQDPVIKQTVLEVFNTKLEHLQRMHRMIRDGFWPEDKNIANSDPSQSLVHYGYSYNENQNHPSLRPQNVRNP